MSKQYGLIIPGTQKNTTAPSREISKPSIFDESSSDSDRQAPPQLKMKNAPMGPGAMERRIARRQQEKALAEDSTIFQYDELYDEMETKREVERKTKSSEPRKPKYIERLMHCAERRKLENERRIERQVQKEREEEGEEFKDKESFVTSAYRKKLEELKKLEEQEKRDDYLESIGDVTKQADLDGFYRHLYEQKLGTTKVVPKLEILPTTASGNEDINYKPIKSMKTQLQRAYRKRHSSDEKDDNSNEDQQLAKKSHLQNNIDADSDFSIDSSSDEHDIDESKEKSDNNNEKKICDKKTPSSTDKEITTCDNKVDANTIALKLDLMKKEHGNGNEQLLVIAEFETPIDPPKKDKSEIWKKRTVGEVFDAAVKRYFERKAMRSA